MQLGNLIDCAPAIEAWQTDMLKIITGLIPNNSDNNPLMSNGYRKMDPDLTGVAVPTNNEVNILSRIINGTQVPNRNNNPAQLDHAIEVITEYYLSTLDFIPNRTHGGAPISILDIRTEFPDQAPSAMSEFYKGGGIVPESSFNANIPTSGDIALGDFYGSRYTIFISVSTNVSDLIVHEYAEANGWDGDSPLVLTIDEGVYVYGATNGTPAMQIGQEFPDANENTASITIINNGYIIGKGGNGGQSDGGDGARGHDGIWIYNENTTIDNRSTGYIAGGGGGGGSDYGAGGGGGAGGGNGGGTQNDGGALNYAGGGGGSPGNTGSNGQGHNSSYYGRGGGAGGEGGYNADRGKDDNYEGAGGGGGRILPGTGGSGGNGGNGGTADGAGQSTAGAPATDSAGGGGGWGAAGGNSDRNPGASGGAAIRKATGLTVNIIDNGEIYGTTTLEI